MTDGDSPDTPYAEDCVITGAARLAGMSVFRSPSIIITDRKALRESGLTKEGPDYSRIRALLNDGAIVQGAEFGPIEYILRKRKGEENGVNREENER